MLERWLREWHRRTYCSSATQKLVVCIYDRECALQSTKFDIVEQREAPILMVFTTDAQFEVPVGTPSIQGLVEQSFICLFVVSEKTVQPVLYSFVFDVL